jgi:uncharacterized damage-inducible protein DinB
MRKRTARQSNPQTQFGQAAVRIFAANERMNQMLIEHLPPAAWTAKLRIAEPSGMTRKTATRTIAAIFTHMHNVRCKWVRLTAPHLKVPLQLNRTHCTPQQARTGLAESAARCTQMLAEAFGASKRISKSSSEGTSENGGRIKTFLRDGWAKPWPVGPEMLCYMLAHEAHHRGQVCMLAHQLGFPLSSKVMSDLWKWEKLWKDCGEPGGSC